MTLAKTLILQQGASDCGVACLASIIRYYEGNARLESLRQLSGTTQQGTSILGLIGAAQQVGFEAEGLEADSIQRLKELNAPTILWVLMNGVQLHYVVCYGWKSHYFLIGDPAKGLVHYTEEDLEAIWPSKALIQLTPNEQFVKSTTETKAKRRWIWQVVSEDVNLLFIAAGLGIAAAMLGISTAVFSQKLLDSILPKHDTKRLVLGLVSLFMLLLFRSFIAYLRGVLLNRQSRNFNNHLIERFYERLLRLPKSFFDGRKTGELIARMNDTRRLQQTINLITGGVVLNTLVVIISTGYIFVYSNILGVITLLSIPIFGGLIWYYNNSIRQSQREVMATYAQNESNYVDTLQGISIIKVANRESVFSQVTKQVYGLFQEKLFVLTSLSLRLGLWGELVATTILVSVFGIASLLVFHQQLKIGEMMGILSMTSTIIPAVSSLAMGFVQWQEAQVAFDRMFEFVSIQPEYEATETANPLLLNDLSIKSLDFRFAGRTRLLKNISIHLPKGRMIALLGESGSGKSTILQVIQRFYQPAHGTILINGQPWEPINTPTLRSVMAVVPQEIKLFSGTLLDNIALGNGREVAEPIVAFCQRLGFAPFFESFPQSYLTVVGEEGVNLSGGQKQLVALARALYQQPQLLLLDEATAAMDRQMEQFVMQLLARLKRQMCIFLVTHRIQNAQKADWIYWLEKGEIILEGSHDELLKSKNHYQQLWENMAG
ncbi:MAG: peptidase domain-containing ABC transporter [Spirosomataceae bacterium]